MAIVSTDKLTGAKVYGGKKGDQKVGKVHSWVFHPTEKRCIGFLVKRPDLLLMFHRPDSFVALDGFDLEEDGLYLHDEKGSRGEAACKKMGLSWEDCVIWVGLAACTKNGNVVGRVGSVSFDINTGVVDSVVLDEGATANVLLGRRVIPASYVLGFKRGVGERLSDDCETDDDLDPEQFGALLVSGDVLSVQNEGGLAEKAGAATAVAGAKVKDAADSAKEAASAATKSVKEAAKKAKPKVSEATKTAGKAVNKGAYLTGRQLSRAKGMFGGFMDEFNKSRK